MTWDTAWTPLAAEQRAAFDRDGYLIVRSAIYADMINQLIAHGDTLIASERRANRQRQSAHYDGFRNLVAVDPTFLPLLTCPSTLPLVVQLMGPHVQIHTSHLIWMQAEAKRGTAHAPGWHRDISTMTRDLEHDRMPRVEIKVAFFLTDCSSPGCGQTLVAAGSHRWRSAWRSSAEHPQPPGMVEPLLRAGDALLFENRTWHAAGDNRSGRARKTAMIGYSHRWMRPDDYDRQEDALLARCSPLQRCLLDASNINYRADCSFAPTGDATLLEQWAAAHGCTAAACH